MRNLFIFALASAALVSPKAFATHPADVEADISKARIVFNEEITAENNTASMQSVSVVVKTEKEQCILDILNVSGLRTAVIPAKSVFNIEQGQSVNQYYLYRADGKSGAPKAMIKCTNLQGSDIAQADLIQVLKLFRASPYKPELRQEIRYESAPEHEDSSVTSAI